MHGEELGRDPLGGERAENGPDRSESPVPTPGAEERVRVHDGAKGKLLNVDPAAAIRLIDELLAQDPAYDERTWPEISAALDRDRPSHRKLFVG